MNQKQQEQLQQGRQLINQGKYQRAIDILQPLNEQTADYQVNRALTEALYHDGQVQLAIKIAEDHVEDYLQSQGGAMQLVTLELAGQQFITARRQAAFVPKWQAELLKQVEAAEAKAQQEMGTSLNAKLKSFYHLGDGSFNKQRQRLIEAEQLPLSMYLTGALFLLRDPFTKPVIKSSLLETLQPLKIDRQVTILWLDDHEYRLNLRDLQPLTKVKEVVVAQQLIDEKYGQSDPSTLSAVNDQFQLQMIFLYPFINKAMVDPAAWVTAMTSFGKLVSPSKAVNDALKWQRKIQRLVDQMR